MVQTPAVKLPLTVPFTHILYDDMTCVPTCKRSVLYLFIGSICLESTGGSEGLGERNSLWFSALAIHRQLGQRMERWQA
jgi:hypothetical protein